MKIVGITACTAGIAHTYLVKEKLVNAARELGHEIKIETQGSIGVEDILDDQDIKQADVVIISADIEISGRERFKGKKILDMPMKMVMKAPKKLLMQIEEKLKEGWSLSRLIVTDRTLLRLGLYEITSFEETPGRVAINEIIEIAKKYSDETSAKFINGVLSQFVTDEA